MTKSMTTVPEALTKAAEQAGLNLTRNEAGMLELSNNVGQGMLFTADFEHEIPIFCANGGEQFEKRFPPLPDTEAAEPESDTASAVEEDDDEVLSEPAQVSAEEFRAFLEQVDDLNTNAQRMIAAIEYDKVAAPYPQNAVLDLVKATQALSELAAAVLEA